MSAVLSYFASFTLNMKYLTLGAAWHSITFKTAAMFTLVITEESVIHYWTSPIAIYTEEARCAGWKINLKCKKIIRISQWIFNIDFIVINGNQDLRDITFFYIRQANINCNYDFVHLSGLKVICIRLSSWFSYLGFNVFLLTSIYNWHTEILEYVKRKTQI